MPQVRDFLQRGVRRGAEFAIPVPLKLNSCCWYCHPSWYKSISMLCFLQHLVCCHGPRKHQSQTVKNDLKTNEAFGVTGRLLPSLGQKDELIVTGEFIVCPVPFRWSNVNAVNFQEKPIKREAEANDMFLAMKEPSWFWLLYFGLAWPGHDQELYIVRITVLGSPFFIFLSHTVTVPLGLLASGFCKELLEEHGKSPDAMASSKYAPGINLYRWGALCMYIVFLERKLHTAGMTSFDVHQNHEKKLLAEAPLALARSSGGISNRMKLHT